MPRYREWVEWKPTERIVVEHYSDGRDPLTTTLQTSVEGREKHVSDIQTPGFHKKKRQGKVIVNDFNTWHTSRSFTPGSIVYQNDSGYRLSYSGDLSAPVASAVPRNLTLESYLGEMRGEALVKAYANIRGETVMGGELLRDLGSTVQMLKHPFRKSYEILSKMHKSASKHYRKTIRSVARANADAWLEYRYAMIPTVADSIAIFHIVNKSRGNLVGERRVVRASVTRAGIKSDTFTDLVLTSLNPYWHASGSVTTDETVGVHAGVIVDVKHQPLAQQISTELGLGTDMLLSTGYEMIPFSFVADWFVQIGPWLQAISLPPGVTVRGNWVTSVVKVAWNYQCTELKSLQFGDPHYGTFGASFHNTEDVVRIANQSLPSYPIATLRWPSVTHAIDAAALLHRPITELLLKGMKVPMQPMEGFASRCQSMAHTIRRSARSAGML